MLLVQHVSFEAFEAAFVSGDQHAALFIDLEQTVDRLAEHCVELVESLWRRSFELDFLLRRQIGFDREVRASLVQNLSHCSHVQLYLIIDVLLLSCVARLAILLKIVAAQELVELKHPARGRLMELYAVFKDGDAVLTTVALDRFLDGLVCHSS